MLRPRLNTTYNCGCQFRCKTWPEAAKHIQETGHVMTMLGVAKLEEVMDEVRDLRSGEYKVARARKPNHRSA